MYFFIDILYIFHLQKQHFQPLFDLILFLNPFKTENNKIPNASLCIVSLLPFRSSLSPFGVEVQPPLMAAGHCSLSSWRRQPTYCQLVLGWRTFHHPSENTIKNTCMYQPPLESLHAASSVTLRTPHPDT